MRFVLLLAVLASLIGFGLFATPPDSAEQALIREDRRTSSRVTRILRKIADWRPQQRDTVAYLFSQLKDAVRERDATRSCRSSSSSSYRPPLEDLDARIAYYIGGNRAWRHLTSTWLRSDPPSQTAVAERRWRMTAHSYRAQHGGPPVLGGQQQQQPLRWRGQQAQQQE